MSETKERKPERNPNLAIWEQSEKPPAEALKEIKGGRISGMTNINPQWRYKKLTEMFGICGVGWWTETVRQWFEPCGEEIVCFVELHLYITSPMPDVKPLPIIGQGGSMLRVNESKGLRCNDEAYKMAVTDALSVCCKQLGIGSAIYEGKWDGDKYADDAPNPQPQPKAKKPTTKPKDQFLVDCSAASKVIGVEACKAILTTWGYKATDQVKAKADKKDIIDAMKAAVKVVEEMG